MEYKILELKGLKSVRVLQVTCTLLLGLLMLPINMNKKFEEFLDEVMKLDKEDKRKVLLDAIHFVELKDEELNAVLSFCTDKNGIPIDKNNINNYKPGQIIEMAVDVCLQVLEIDVFFCPKNS